MAAEGLVVADSLLELTRHNAELIARVDDLTRRLAQREALTQLTAGVVHDLRNALHVVSLAAETLHQTAEDPGDADLAEEILTAARHGTSLAVDLLTLARQEGTHAAVVTCSDALARVQRLIQRVGLQRVECTFEVESSVWPILVERSQFEAALINLSVNARDAMPSGGRLHISARNLSPGSTLPAELPPGDYVEISVSDTGIGMSAAVVARSTEAFFTTKEASGGTGLGLAMALAFVQRSGGALSIESEPQRGTRVRMVLPRARLPSDSAALDPEVNAKVSKMLERIRTPELRHALEAWRALCPVHGLPPPLATEGKLTAQADHSLVLTVEPAGEVPILRLLRIGDGLARALGHSELGDLPLHGSIAVGTLAAAYRRAFHSRFPSYEYLNYEFKDGAPGVFERLILPAASDGTTVSHLLGVIHLSAALERGGRDHVA